MASLLRRDGSGSICFITARDKGWAWSALAREKDSILREIKKSTAPFTLSLSLSLSFRGSGFF
jgi:hypothetical protein